MSLPNAATLTATVYDCVMALAQRCADWLGLEPQEPPMRLEFSGPHGERYVLIERRSLTMTDLLQALEQRARSFADWLGVRTLPDEPPPPLLPVAFWVPDGEYYVLVDRQRTADGRTQWWPVLLKRPPPLPPVTANKPPPAILRPTDASVRSIVEPRTSDNLGAVAALQMQERDAMLARMRAVFH